MRQVLGSTATHEADSGSPLKQNRDELPNTYQRRYETSDKRVNSKVKKFALTV
jgi:hypothetical protein